MDFAMLSLLFAAAVTIHNIEEAVRLPGWSRSAGRFHVAVTARSFRFAVTVLTLVAWGAVAWSAAGSEVADYLVSGYALAKWRFRGSEFFFIILLVGSFIPYQVMIYPLVVITREMGIYGTLWAVIMVHSIFGMPILTLLFRNYFASVPIELFKAARIDGAGFWSIFLRIMLPMSLPIFTVAIILQVTGIWNDFLFGVIFAGPTNYPMTVQLNNIVNSIQGVREYNVNMAATILTGLVPLTIYFISGRLFVRGIAAGAVKG